MKWTKHYEDILIQLYPTHSDQEIATIFTQMGFTQRNPKNIWKKRKRMGLKRSKESLRYLIEKNKEKGAYQWHKKISQEQFKERKEKAAQTLKKTWRKEKYRSSMGLRTETKLMDRKGKKGKLNECDIYEILHSKDTCRKLSQKYKCSVSTISYIRKGKIYKETISKIKSRNFHNPCQQNDFFFA